MTNPFWKILCCFSILTILPACFEQVGTNASGPTGLGGEASTSGAAGDIDEEAPVDEGEEGGDAEKRPSAEAGDTARGMPVVADRGGAGGGTFGDGSSSRDSSGGRSSSGSVADAGGPPPAAGDTEAHPSYTVPSAATVASGLVGIQAFVVKEDGSMIARDRLDMTLALFNPETGEEEALERYCLFSGRITIVRPVGVPNDVVQLPRWEVLAHLSPGGSCSRSLDEAFQRKIVLKGSYRDWPTSVLGGGEVTFEGREVFPFPSDGEVTLDPFILNRPGRTFIIDYRPTTFPTLDFRPPIIP